MKSKSQFEQFYKSIHKSTTIVLVGFMGSGKTTFGKQLAKILNYHFVDTDKEIEDLVGMSIPELFEKKGEAYFRTIEHQVLDKIDVKNTVIATGGGMPCYLDNMESLNQIGVTVYLRFTAEELYDRLKNESEHRPLLKGKTNEELFSYIEELLQEREPFYLKAQTIF